MNVKQLETEQNYDKEGNDRVWFSITGLDNKTGIELNGVHGTIKDSIVDELGFEVNEREALAVKHALNI